MIDSLPVLSPVVNRLYELVQQGPTDFEITILPSATNVESEGDNDNDDQQVLLSLDQSLVLVEGKYLGMDGRSLPWITRAIRKDYKNIKKAILSMNENENKNLLLQQLYQVTLCLMLVNPDHSTAWADRRRCLLGLSLDWALELEFVTLLMTQHSKA